MDGTREAISNLRWRVEALEKKLAVDIEEESLPSENDNMLASFMAYCYDHPEQRFWQALRNWSGWGMVSVSRNTDGPYYDTFYWPAKGPPNMGSLK